MGDDKNKKRKEISVVEMKISDLQADIESLKFCVPPDSSKEAESEASLTERKSTPNMQLLDYIDNKIAAKEKELECPVCFEVASAPIFMCNDLHLICSDCRPKVSICPECREPYPAKAKRHRYAEKAAEELAELMEERDQFLNS